MAEQIHYRPAEARQFRPETEAEIEHLQGRLAEVNALLDELHDSGILRWLKDFAGAFPQISSIAVDGMNTAEGHAGMRNLLVVAKQLGKIDPDQLERTFEAANKGMTTAGEGATEDTPYNPPGVTGVFKLLHDKELWATLSPVIAGVKAFSAARKDSADPDRDKKSD
ncbi:DUF1641 domain-containing protein [Salinisphaera aquimarina]|uniref:DUF1641 domain-containing protein n=1 Tax=Salinisphaera aquimarina TaxID=2094031 RepID=A0ABV7EQJ6_9GAMM